MPDAIEGMAKRPSNDALRLARPDNPDAQVAAPDAADGALPQVLGTSDPAAPWDLTETAETPLPADVPVGGPPALVRAWFDAAAAAVKTENDGTLAAAYRSAGTYRRRAKADNTRAAYRSAVRA